MVSPLTKASSKDLDLENTSLEGSEVKESSKKRKREDDDDDDDDSCTDSLDDEEDDDSIVVPDDEAVVVPAKLSEEEEERLAAEEAARVLAEGLIVKPTNSRYPLRANIKKPTQNEYFEKLRLEMFLEDEKKERISTLKAWWRSNKQLISSKVEEKDNYLLKPNTFLMSSSIEVVREFYYTIQKIMIDEGLAEATDAEETDDEEEDEDESFSSDEDDDDEEDDEEEDEEDDEEDDEEEEEDDEED
jgi:hypothetical protein